MVAQLQATVEQVIKIMLAHATYVSFRYHHNPVRMVLDMVIFLSKQCVHTVLVSTYMPSDILLLRMPSYVPYFPCIACNFHCLFSLFSLYSNWVLRSAS